MKLITDTKQIIEYLKLNQHTNIVPFDTSYFGCTHMSDIALIDEALKKLDQDKILIYNGKDIQFNISDILKYEEFYNVRMELDKLYWFLMQSLSDAYCVKHFKQVKFTTYITREVMNSCIYNFSSVVSIAINKIFKDNNGKYKIEDIASTVRKYLKNYLLTNDLKTAKTLKTNFSTFSASVNNKIQDFNDYRDTLFAHSDKDIMLKVENVDINSATDILKKCLDYCVSLINLIDDNKISNEHIENELKDRDLKANYFSAQLIRK